MLLVHCTGLGLEAPLARKDHSPLTLIQLSRDYLTILWSVSLRKYLGSLCVRVFLSRSFGHRECVAITKPRTIPFLCTLLPRRSTV